jgi:hypothetical protein
MKAYGAVESQIHSFFFSELEVKQSLVSKTAVLHPRKGFLRLLDIRMGEPQKRV